MKNVSNLPHSDLENWPPVRQRIPLSMLAVCWRTKTKIYVIIEQCRDWGICLGNEVATSLRFATLRATSAQCHICHPSLFFIKW